MVVFILRLLYAAFFILSAFSRSPCVWADAGENDYSRQAPLASRSLLISLDGVGDVIWAAGSHGHILKQDSSGIWNQSKVQASVLLTAIRMLDSSTGWAVGHDAVIVYTDDTGNTWSRVYSDKDQEKPLLDIVPLSPQKIIAVGAYGYYLVSDNGGTSWKEGIVNADHDFHLNAISHNLNGILYIVAEAGHIYRSKDNGLTWNTLSSPYEGSLFDVLAWEDNHVAVTGLRGRFYYSGDKGESWSRIPTNIETSLNSLIRLRNGQLLVAGHTGNIVITDKNYQQSYLYQLKNRVDIADIYEYESNHVIFVGEDGIHNLDLCEIFSPTELTGCVSK